jgi:isopentenyl-diphosphate delta-isomerase
LTEVVLVDEQDNPLGFLEKMEAHRQGVLHRAFSVFIFNDNKELLIQKRAINKYHNGGVWSNTCCSHPLPGEDVANAAARRLMEEMGFSTTLKKAFDFIYLASFSNGLTEHEFDHVYTGKYDGKVSPDNSEVDDYCYMSLGRLEKEMQSNPDDYTAWLKIAIPRLKELISTSGSY